MNNFIPTDRWGFYITKSINFLNLTIDPFIPIITRLFQDKNIEYKTHNSNNNDCEIEQSSLLLEAID